MSRIGAPIVAEVARPNLQEPIKRYGIGRFELDPARLVLSLDGEPLGLGPRVVALLTVLVERAGEVVTKDEILDRVWAGEDVCESNVPQSVYTLRKVLRDHGLGDAIATVQRRGYRFTAPVELLAEPPRTAVRVRRPPIVGRWSTAVLAAVLVLLATVPAARAVSSAPALSARGGELYRLGRYYWNLRTPDGLAKSTQLFAAVVASDPRSPLGYTGLADANLMLADYGRPHVKAAPLYARARAELRTALALDRDSAAVHASLGQLRLAGDKNPRVAEAEYRRAIALDPTYALAHHWYGAMLLERGRLAAASRELRVAMALDPVSSATGAWLAEASYLDHRYADAIVYSRRALDLNPERVDALRQLGLAYELGGDVPRAIAIFERLHRNTMLANDTSALLAEAYARAGRRDEARAALREAVRGRADEGNTALAMLALGDRTGAHAMMDVMVKKYGPPTLLDPRFDPFRRELRLQPPATDSSS